MAQQPDHRIISPREDGQWENKIAGAERASSLHETQREAIHSARAMLSNQGGGQITVQGTDGRIKDRKTVATS